MTERFVNASPVTRDGALTPEQVDDWQKQGFTFVSGLFPATLIEQLTAAATKNYPAPDAQGASAFTNFGSSGRLVFPSPEPSFNELTLHPNLLAAVSQLLGVAVVDIRLTQSDLWPKYFRDAASRAGTQDNSDQRIHVDYPNHSLVHPPPWSRPEAVELILYLSDVDNCGGSTAVVPREGEDDPAYPWPIVDSPGIGDLRYINSRDDAETYFAAERPERKAFRAGLYERERYTHFKPGDVIFYRHDTWHRGTPLKPDALRLVQNITYKKAASEWISTLHTGWSWSAYRDDKMWEKLIAEVSLDQRAVLGFPQPGSDYWCAETISAVEARYGMYGFDGLPYR